MLSRILKPVLNVLEGFELATGIYKGNELENEIAKGNSPNRSELFIARLMQVITLFLPTIRFMSRRTPDADGNTVPITSKTPLQYYSLLTGMVSSLFIVLFELIYRAIHKLSHQNILRKALFPILTKLDQYVSKVNYLAWFAIMGLAISLGAWMIPASFLFFNAIYYIQSLNLYSQSIKDRIDTILFWSTFIAGIILGDTLDKVFFLYSGIERISNLFERTTVLFLELIKRIGEPFLPEYAYRQLSTLTARLVPVQPKTFRCEATFDTFYDSIRDLSQSQNLRVSMAYVQDNKDTLPPVIEGIDSQDLLKIFDQPKLNRLWKDSHGNIIRDIKNDWKLSESEIDYSNQPECLGRVRAGLKNYINMVRTGTLPGTIPGSAEKYKRYLNGITHLVREAMQLKKYDLVIRVLIKLGIEGGHNCSIGKGRTSEEAYNMLVAEDDTGACSPSSRVARVLQQNREFHFQEHISNAWFLGVTPKKIHDILYHAQDTHGYNVKIATAAPRLGLPNLSAQTDMTADAGNGGFFFSLVSRCEQSFWMKTTPQVIMGEMQAAISGTYQFNASDIQRWYQEFLDKHQIGTSDQREDMRTTIDGPAPVAYQNGQVTMPEDFLTLMLLDMGVFYLEGDNKISAPSVAPILHLANNARSEATTIAAANGGLDQAQTRGNAIRCAK